MRVILASASPRRRELLATVVPIFEVVPANVDEEAFVSIEPLVTAQHLATIKARYVADHNPDALVIGGDTVVAYEENGEWLQLAKPEDGADAFRMLRILSDRTHTVATGVALIWPEGQEVFVERTHVTFRKLTDEEISEYILSGEPMDKAGAYGLQNDPNGFIIKVEGSKNNVIGLPVEEIAPRLAKILG